MNLKKTWINQTNILTLTLTTHAHAYQSTQIKSVRASEWVYGLSLKYIINIVIDKAKVNKHLNDNKHETKEQTKMQISIYLYYIHIINI